LSLSLALLMALSACAGVSQTQIEAGQTFKLGGEQRRNLLVEGRNTGPVPVEILVEQAGQRRMLLTVQPAQLFSKTFGPGEIILLRNTSATRQATVKIELNADLGGLSMVYESNASAPR
jgi:hypothetical protein